MSFSTCKYDRELRFIWSRLNYLKKNMDSGKITGDELKEAKEEYEMLQGRQNDIESTYIESEMGDYLVEFKASCLAPPLNPEDFGLYLDKDDDEDVAEVKEVRTMACEHPLAQITSINAEIAELDNALVNAQLNGDDAECKKLEMSIDSLKSRRADLIEQMKAIEEEAEEEDKPVQASDGELEEVKKDLTSLRTQLGILRTEVLDLKGMVTQLSDYMNMHR
jgi:hypothetical protein